MNDTFHQTVNDPTGHIHSGVGDQHIHEGLGVEDLLGLDQSLRGRSPSTLLGEHLKWLAKRFIAPPGMAEATERLSSLHAVFLKGAEGDGRHTAAKMLLHGAGRGRTPIRELLPDMERTNAIGLLPRNVTEGDRLLISLARNPNVPWSLFEEQVGGLLDVLPDRRASLVVVLSEENAKAVPPYYYPYLQTLQRPDCHRLLRRYLDVGRLTVGEQLPESLQDRLANRPPVGELARLATDLTESWPKTPTGTDFATWCAEVVQGATGWAETVADLCARLPGSQRALLLAAAVLHGAHAHTVYAGAKTLLASVEHPLDDEPLLDRSDLAELLAAIEATADPATGAVTFKKARYELAVIQHFWQHVPDLRTTFHRWAAGIVREGQLTTQERGLAVRRLSDLYLRVGRPAELIGLVTSWARKGGSKHELRSAYEALEHGLSDARHGQTFRQQIYDWSITPALEPNLAHVLVAVCGGPMAVLHPDQALVRLHHLARHQSGQQTAERGVIDLVEQDHRLYRRLLERLAYGLDRYDHACDVRLFLALSAPTRLDAQRGPGGRPLLLERGVGAQLTAGWRALYERAPHEKWQPLARAWFAAADAHGADELSHPLISIPVSAAAGEPMRLALLYEAASGVGSGGTPPTTGQFSLTDRVLTAITSLDEPHARPRATAGNEEPSI